MKVEILTTPDCSNCKVVERYLDELGIPYKTIDVTENTQLLQKYPIFTAPGIVINDRLEFTGIPSKKDLAKKIASLKG